jgi:hypothetical protein
LWTRWLIEILFPFWDYVGFVGHSKGGYNAKKRSEAALITAQNGMFFFDYRYAFFTVYSMSCCGILEDCGAMWHRLAAFCLDLSFCVAGSACPLAASFQKKKS